MNLLEFCFGYTLQKIKNPSFTFAYNDLTINIQRSFCVEQENTKGIHGTEVYKGTKCKEYLTKLQVKKENIYLLEEY